MRHIPVFFSCDDNYVPFLGVTLNSIKKNKNDVDFYDIYVLTNGISPDKQKELSAFEDFNLKIEYVDVNDQIKDHAKELDDVRDYYTQAIFYRLFIAKLFPRLTKAIYLDCDIVVLSDLAKFYDIDLSDKVLGVIVDDVVNGNAFFQKYCMEAVGSYKDKYFNSGVLLMNLDAYRKEGILERFLYLLKTYNFKSVAPDQDYLNHMCRDLVKYIDKSWDRMPVDDDYDGEINIIHYNMFMKPWKYDIKYDEYFWKYAKDTIYYDYLLNFKANYGDDLKASDYKGVERMEKMCADIMASDNTFVKRLDKNGKE